MKNSYGGAFIYVGFVLDLNLKLESFHINSIFCFIKIYAERGWFFLRKLKFI